MTEEMKKEILDLVTEEIGEEFEVFFTKADNNNGTEREVVSVIPKESAKDSGNHIGMVFAIQYCHKPFFCCRIKSGQGQSENPDRLEIYLMKTIPFFESTEWGRSETDY